MYEIIGETAKTGIGIIVCVNIAKRQLFTSTLSPWLLRDSRLKDIHCEDWLGGSNINFTFNVEERVFLLPGNTVALPSEAYNK